MLHLPRSSLTKERVAIVVVSAVLLWSWGPTPAHIAGAVAGVAFFCWFVGWRRPPEPPGDERSKSGAS